MGKPSRKLRSPFLAMLVLSVLLMKLILAAQSLFTPGGISGLLADSDPASEAAATIAAARDGSVVPGATRRAAQTTAAWRTFPGLLTGARSDIEAAPGFDALRLQRGLEAREPCADLGTEVVLHGLRHAREHVSVGNLVGKQA